ncbi:MAG TPA: hypothetical protein VFA14_04485, partial [Herbaspirillum sp.]|nr:hypothetical protein [Herbaspirillum sp.]
RTHHGAWLDGAEAAGAGTDFWRGKVMQEPPIVITHLVCDCDGVLLDSENIALRVLGFTGVTHDRAGMAKELYETGAEKVFV